MGDDKFIEDDGWDTDEEIIKPFKFKKKSVSPVITASVLKTIRSANAATL